MKSLKLSEIPFSSFDLDVEAIEIIYPDGTKTKPISINEICKSAGEYYHREVSNLASYIKGIYYSMLTSLGYEYRYGMIDVERLKTIQDDVERLTDKLRKIIFAAIDTTAKKKPFRVEIESSKKPLDVELEFNPPRVCDGDWYVVLLDDGNSLSCFRIRINFELLYRNSYNIANNFLRIVG